ncbi:hypothetical protein H0H93_010314 [Arthromyces matolae]|nr:hypothetical protein H0H93_010314 [Arthromyces matolae]
MSLIIPYIIFAFKRLLLTISGGPYHVHVSQAALWSANAFSSYLIVIYPSLNVAKQSTISHLTVYKDSSTVYAHEYYIGVNATKGDSEDYEPLIFELQRFKSRRPHANKIRLVEVESQLPFLPRDPGDELTTEIVLASPIPLYLAATIASLICFECSLHYGQNYHVIFTDTFLQLIKRLVGEDNITITPCTKKGGLPWEGSYRTNDFPSIDDLYVKLLKKIEEFETFLVQKADAAKLRDEKLKAELNLLRSQLSEAKQATKPEDEPVHAQ